MFQGRKLSDQIQLVYHAHRLSNAQLHMESIQDVDDNADDHDTDPHNHYGLQFT